MVQSIPPLRMEAATIVYTTETFLAEANRPKFCMCIQEVFNTLLTHISSDLSEEFLTNIYQSLRIENERTFNPTQMFHQ